MGRTLEDKIRGKLGQGLYKMSKKAGNMKNYIYALGD
jgi:hypothetical protein